MYMNCMRYMDVTVKPISAFWNSNHLSPVFGGSTYKDMIFRGDKSGYGWVWLKTSSKEDHKLWSFWNRGNPNLMHTFQVPCQHKPQLTQAFSLSLLSRLLDFSLLSWGQEVAEFLGDGENGLPKSMGNHGESLFSRGLQNLKSQKMTGLIMSLGFFIWWYSIPSLYIVEFNCHGGLAIPLLVFNKFTCDPPLHLVAAPSCGCRDPCFSPPVSRRYGYYSRCFGSKPLWFPNHCRRMFL